MSNWVKFSDRLPTEGDANINGDVIVHYADGAYAFVNIWNLDAPHNAVSSESHWLDNVPPVPKPRTLEDVARDMIGCDGIPITKPYVVHSALIEEMKDILEKLLDNQDS